MHRSREWSRNPRETQEIRPARLRFRRLGPARTGLAHRRNFSSRTIIDFDPGKNSRQRDASSECAAPSAVTGSSA
ncbi:hypothetical protein [Lysobacter enzymogenes]|uniref:hypothetical protein n=1 Tax=Lysobacter enzymogenes TaxID=69 RepID=UPI001AF1F8F5|nr:hypothetical protein [Lysobacter enzymogenes]QQQ02797.1 hypothetical protein JHW41_07455 [Lysobacter enzymogenes]